MTGNAIHGCVLLFVTLHAEAHGVIYLALGHGLRGHIAVTLRAVDSRPNMRRVIEFHMRGRLETIHALPGYVLQASAISRKLLDLWFICGDHLMADHAKVNARNSGVGSLINAHMAIRTAHPFA